MLISQIKKKPYASLVYGNFAKGFPPTMIQLGTKEILLSDSVNLYRALDQASIPFRWNIYDGMPHVFQVSLNNSTESTLVISKTIEFIKGYLNY